MSKNKCFKIFLPALMAGSLLFSGNVYSQNAAPVTVDGLELIEDSTLDVAYLKPGADFSNYTKFMIGVAEVRFQKDWERDMRRGGGSRLRISSNDKEKIIKNLSDIFYDSFTKELQENDDFLVVDQAGEDVLVLRVSVIDLYITAPDLRGNPGMVTSFVANAGSMILVGELVDSTSGEILARFADGKAARSNITMQWSTGVSNRQEAKIMFRGWAKILREAMEEIHGLND